ncbi:MAG: thermonuclease family protein [Candidatus Aenigmarchaeota archaeon]|nr:thermonuclease family protein [Candidatus Aenigmarchaeota archaeon]
MKIGNSAIIFAFAAVLALAFLAHYQSTDGKLCKGFARCIEGEVDRVIDGDTLVIANKTIRLALVNSPESNEDAGRRAGDFTANLCPPGSGAVIDEDDYQTGGSYGRIVAVVHCSGKNLNELLLESGLGSITPSFCEESEFGNEEWAKRNGC